MLTLKVPESVFFDTESNRLIQIPSVTLKMEHSLLSISKWEAEWEIPYLGDGRGNQSFTDEQHRSYFRHMIVEGEISDLALLYLPEKCWEEVSRYISKRATATTIRESPNEKPPSRRQIITAELIYAWLSQVGISFEWAEKQPLNKVLMTLRVREELDKQQAPKKGGRKPAMSKGAVDQRRLLNKQRRAQYGMTG